MIHKTNLHLATWNCRGLKSNSDFIKILLSENNIDVLFLQETWLHSYEDSILAEISKDYNFYSKSGMDSNMKIIGRPFGGTAFLWRKELTPFIKSIDIDDKRLSAMRLSSTFGDIVLLNCYLPTSDN